MNHVAKKTEGFTLIELMLAMSFIAALLLAIALTIIQVGNIYNQGMTLKEITQSGRDITTDVRSTISKSSAFTFTTDYVTVPIGSGNPSGGRLCTGTYSYIWNFGKVKNTTSAGITKYAGGSAKQNDWINLVKVSDVAKIYCARVGFVLLNPNLTTADSTAIQAQELLQAGDHELAIHQFKVTSNDLTLRDPVTAQQLYSLDFAVGTNKYFTDGSGRHSTLDATNLSCLDPSDPYSDPNYCSVQIFSLVLRAGNRFN